MFRFSTVKIHRIKYNETYCLHLLSPAMVNPLGYFKKGKGDEYKKQVCSFILLLSNALWLIMPGDCDLFCHRELLELNQCAIKAY